MKIRKGKYRFFFGLKCACLLACSCALVYSLYQIINWYIDSKNTKEIAVAAEEVADVQEVADGENTEIIASDDAPESPYWKFLNMSLLDVDLDELRKQNSDIVGWIKVDGTNVNYPFMQTGDNDYYLHHSLDHSWNDAGWVFADFRLKLDETDKNTIIYAHGRYDNTMFGSLREVSHNSWLNDPSNFVIRTVTDNEMSMWQVFSVYHIPVTSDYIRTSFINDEDFGEFANMLKNRSFHDFGTNVLGSDRILTLSTCYNENERAVVHAKLIKRAPR
jgi:sortase B